VSDVSPRTRRIAWAVLGVAMAISATWLMVAARNTSFMGDDVYYYARYIAHGYTPEISGGAEFFLAPHNSHFQLGGKLLYRLLFDVFGAKYWVFRAADVVGVLAAVGLFFVLVSRRIGPVLALAPSILLLFLGYAWEPLIWAFDMHTVFALVFGLAAVLALERGDRRGDVLACTLLVLSISMIELGLAFAVGVAVSVLLRPDRARRAWIFLIPLLLYAIWWIWARKFHQPGVTLLNIHLIPIDLTNALAAITGSVFGLNPTGVGVAPQVTTITASGTFLAGLAVVGLALRIHRGKVPSTLWIFLAVAIVYWLTIALGGRPPDSSRYIFAGTVMVLLVAADAVAERRFSGLAIAGAFVVVALAIPPNIAKFYDGRRIQLNDAEASRTEYAMLELAGRNRVEPDYTPGSDPAVTALGGGVYTPLPAGDYFHAADDFGPLSYSLDRIREEPLLFRIVADATLVDALRLGLHSSAAAPDPSRCLDVTDAKPEDPAYFPLPAAGVLIGSKSQSPVEVKVSRFAKDSGGFGIGQLEPGAWSTLKAPPDAAPDPWRVLVGGPVYVCRRG
jgi:hypothetical protein